MYIIHKKTAEYGYLGVRIAKMRSENNIHWKW